MSKNGKLIDGSEMVLAIGPDGKSPSQMTAKAFGSLYQERGFEIVERGNVERAENGADRANGRSLRDAGRAGEKTVVMETGSAASIAASIGLEGEGGAKKNEKHSNPDSEIKDGRKSAGRDRGGSR